MDPTEFRPLTAQERRTLAGLAEGDGDRLNVLALFFLFFMALFVFGVVGIRILSGPPTRRELAVAGACAALVVLSFAVHAARRLGRARKVEREACAADLAGGRVSSQTFDVVDAVQVEELEDEGSSYYLKLADGRVLFLSGQYLYDPEDEGAFPSTRLRVTRAPRSRLLFDLECLGSPLKPSSKRPHFTLGDFEADRVPADGAILQVDFESLRTSGDAR